MPVAAARAAMLARTKPRAAIPVKVGADALGLVLAKPVTTVRDQPPFDAAAMDGYAVTASGLSETVSTTLRVIGESAAGRGFAGLLRDGEAVRIFTGAPCPQGAAFVVPQELAARNGDQVTLKPRDQSGPYIRPRGADFQSGEVLLQAGLRLDPWRLSLCAAAGRGDVLVRPKPRLAILSTGDELAEAGASPKPDQIFDSGAPALTALTTLWGAKAVRLRPTGDDVAAIAAAVEGAEVELIVMIGGASVGDHDLAKPALARLGLDLMVESVAVRPGKPTWFGALPDGRLVLGLPGNPASALVCAELFLRPLIDVLSGAEPGPTLIAAQLAGPLPANGPREHWMRAALAHRSDGVLAAQPLKDQDSSLVSVFAAADALLMRPANAPAAPVGEVATVLPLMRR
jgi:molybdopterin molybdotransferase